MGNRGSKFHKLLWIKEQRVDGTGYIFLIYLRCTLRCLERGTTIVEKSIFHNVNKNFT